MLAKLTHPLYWEGIGTIPAGTVGSVRRSLRGGLLFRVRGQARTIVVVEGDYEPVRAEMPLLPMEPAPRLRLAPRPVASAVTGQPTPSPGAPWEAKQARIIMAPDEAPRLPGWVVVVIVGAMVGMVLAVWS